MKLRWYKPIVGSKEQIDENESETILPDPEDVWPDSDSLQDQGSGQDPDDRVIELQRRIAAQGDEHTGSLLKQILEDQARAASKGKGDPNKVKNPNYGKKQNDNGTQDLNYFSKGKRDSPPRESYNRNRKYSTGSNSEPLGKRRTDSESGDRRRYRSPERRYERKDRRDHSRDHSRGRREYGDGGNRSHNRNELHTENRRKNSYERERGRRRNSYSDYRN